jgi:branched-chain amino acid transport system substrate-binding protein
MRARIPIAASATVLAASLIAGCGSSGGSGSAGTPASSYQVLAVLPMTGASSLQAQADLQGLKAAAAVLNARGGLLGHRIALTVKDDQLNPTLAITEVDSALASGSPPQLVVAGSTSNETDALAPILKRSGVLNMQVTSDTKIDDGSTYPQTFGVTVTIPSVINALVSYVKAQRPSKVAFVYADDALGTAVAPYEIGALKAAGINVVSDSYSATALDDSATLLKMQAAHPSLLIMEAFGADAGYLISSKAKLGWSIPTIGDSALAASNVAALVPAADLAGIRVEEFAIQQYRPFAQQNAATRAFLTALARQGPVRQPISSGAFAYDILMLLDIAARQANSVATDRVVAALNDLRPTADPGYVLFSDPRFTAAQHALTLPPADYAFVPASGVVDGFSDVPSGANPLGGHQ